MRKPVFFNNIPAITKSKGFISLITLALVIANFFIPHFTAGILIISILGILFKTGYFILNSLFNEANKIEINRLANISILILLLGNVLHFLGPEVHLLTGIALVVSSIAPIFACSLSLIIYAAIAFMHSKEDQDNKESSFEMFKVKIKHRHLAYFLLFVVFLNILFITLALTVFPSIIITLHTPMIIATTFISLALPIYSIYNAVNEFLKTKELSITAVLNTTNAQTHTRQEKKQPLSVDKASATERTTNSCNNTSP